MQNTANWHADWQRARRVVLAPYKVIDKPLHLVAASRDTSVSARPQRWRMKATVACAVHPAGGFPGQAVLLAIEVAIRGLAPLQLSGHPEEFRGFGRCQEPTHVIVGWGLLFATRGSQVEAGHNLAPGSNNDARR
jgi:hypothetical protein